MPKFVPYYRVSTAGQGRSGLGLDAQVATVQRHLSEGDTTLAAFVEVESAKKSDRPQLDKALAHCRIHKATLIVAKVDRLTRSVSFLMKLLEANVPVVFCDLPHTTGAVGRFLLQQMASVAELEAGLISERTKAALKAKVERDGQWDRKARHHLVPGVGQRAAVAAKLANAQAHATDLMPAIDEIRGSGVTTATGIAKQLNAMGITTARGGQWQAVQVQRVLAHAGSGF